MYALLSGAVAALSLIAATLFLRSYKKMRDVLFAYFAAAFALFGATQLYLGIRNVPELNEPTAYLPRLVVFILILVAIVVKNRSARRPLRRDFNVEDLTERRRKIAR